MASTSIVYEVLRYFLLGLNSFVNQNFISEDVMLCCCVLLWTGGAKDLKHSFYNS